MRGRHIMKPGLKSTTFAALLLSTTWTAFANEPIIGGPCEGCELVIVGMPGDLSSESRIAPVDEPGEPLRIEGVVTNQEGDPVPGIIVYAYQTDAAGKYPEASTRHGRLRGWVRTDTNGRYRFNTIRPGAYPGRNIAQHVHMHIIEPGRATYFIADIHFSDDPMLSDHQKRRMENGRGGSGLVDPKHEPSGDWLVHRDIVLGLDVPGYSR